MNKLAGFIHLFVYLSREEKIFRKNRERMRRKVSVTLFELINEFVKKVGN